MRRVFIALIILINVSISSSVSYGWIVEGHNIIEAAAYRRLLASSDIERLSKIAGHPFSGKDALDLLIAFRILDKPHRWGEKVNDDPLLSMPIVRSGNLDMVLSRQFEGNSQCFHFMAEASDVYWDTTTDPTYHYPHMLYDSAYPRCIAFITSMFNVILNNVEASHAGDHDVYGLIHCIADSYSAAHVDRDTATWKIIHLNVWQPTAFIPYFFHPQAEPFYHDDSHHKARDQRDLDYFIHPIVNSTCSNYISPWQVDDDCLSERALKAVETVEELLIVLSECVLHNQKVGHEDRPYENSVWQTYVETYFVGWKSQAPIRMLRPDEREWRPLLQMGIEDRSTTDGIRAYDYTARVNLDIPIAVIAPLTAGIDVAYGLREFQDHSSSPILKVGYSLVFQLNEEFQVRSTPLMREFVLSKQYADRSRYLISFLDLEAIIDRRLYIRLEPPRFGTSGWVPNDYGLAVGYTNKFDLGRWFSEHFSRYDSQQPEGAAWEVPSEDVIKHSDLGSGMSFSGSAIDYIFNRYYNSILGISALVVWDRNTSGVRKKGFANGAEIDYFLPLERASAASHPAQSLRLGYLLRYYLTRDLAITTEPVMGVKPFPATEPHPSGDLSWDVQSTVGMVFIMGHSDFTLTLMRVSWRDLVAHQWPFYQNFPAGFRIGANFYIP
ncbi:MAG TPA: hypothetical protein VG537_06445 [Candidatus Kapabacteria bacterium]|jgi:hypothetical protein|nr:hypothetical protein [Candidatus Kapabacteria bacterium]